MKKTSGISGMSGLGRGAGSRRPKREVADVPEPRREDKSLDKLIGVRKQRLERLQREAAAAREEWRQSRQLLREAKERWRTALRETQEAWASARAEFFKMKRTSGEFRVAKVVYERMKAEAASLHLKCGECVRECKVRKQAWFQARKVAADANRSHEKLGLLRDELKTTTMQKEG